MSADVRPTEQAYEPVLRQFSKEQMVGRAKEFMRNRFDHPNQLDPDKRGLWYERLGVLMLYVDHLWGESL